ncbi:peptide ABC transporter substrate-binding protein [Candidatus Uhrbacteria bacterium]|nr:peptide ABC transporter substrate-binding protein [Candidatus Uhrbacteria bacterium]
MRSLFPQRSSQNSARPTVERSFWRADQKKNLTMRQVLSVTKTRMIPSWKQWKQLPLVLTIPEKRVMTSALAVMIFAFVALVGTYVFSHRIEIPAVGGDYTEGLVGEPRFVNPLYAVASDVDQDLTSLIYSGLLKYDPEQGYVPDLAESLAVSNDGLTYTLKIKDHAKFHNGEDVRARDVLFTIDAIQNPAYRSPLIDNFYNVSVVQVDEKTVSFLLKEPFAPFKQYLTVGILPASLWAEILPQNAPLAALNLQPIGSGPYKFSEFAKDGRGSIRSYTLTRNDDFYDDAAFIETLSFKFYSDAASLSEALDNKNIEGASVIPADVLEDMAKNSNVELLQPLIPQETVLSMNQSVQPILKDLVVRTAIAQAIQKQDIVESLALSGAKVIEGPILEGFVGYDATLQSVYNVTQANESLEAAGYRLDESSGLRAVKDGNKKSEEGADDETEAQTATETLHFTLTAADTQEMHTVAQSIQQDLGAIGISVTLNFIPTDVIYASVIEPKNFELLLSSILFEGDSDPYPFWHSSQAKTGGLNFTSYANSDVDTLLVDARKELDESVRATKYQQFGQLLAKDVPAVFLYQSRFAYAVAAKIHLTPLTRIVSPSDRFADVTSWYIKTKKALR